MHHTLQPPQNLTTFSTNFSPTHTLPSRFPLANAHTKFTGSKHYLPCSPCIRHAFLNTETLCSPIRPPLLPSLSTSLTLRFSHCPPPAPIAYHQLRQLSASFFFYPSLPELTTSLSNFPLNLLLSHCSRHSATSSPTFRSNSRAFLESSAYYWPHRILARALVLLLLLTPTTSIIALRPRRPPFPTLISPRQPTQHSISAAASTALFAYRNTKQLLSLTTIRFHAHRLPPVSATSSFSFHTLPAPPTIRYPQQLLASNLSLPRFHQPQTASTTLRANLRLFPHSSLTTNNDHQPQPLYFHAPSPLLFLAK